MPRLPRRRQGKKPHYIAAAFPQRTAGKNQSCDDASPTLPGWRKRPTWAFAGTAKAGSPGRLPCDEIPDNGASRRSRPRAHRKKKRNPNAGGPTLSRNSIFHPCGAGPQKGMFSGWEDFRHRPLPARAIDGERGKGMERRPPVRKASAIRNPRFHRFPPPQCPVIDPDWPRIPEGVAASRRSFGGPAGPEHNSARETKLSTGEANGVFPGDRVLRSEDDRRGAGGQGPGVLRRDPFATAFGPFPHAAHRRLFSTIWASFAGNAPTNCPKVYFFVNWFRKKRRRPNGLSGLATGHIRVV